MNFPPQVEPHSSKPTEPPHSVAIIGGGISGLSAAQRLTEHLPNARITIFESTNRLGGILQTTVQDGFSFEHSADNFIVTDELPYAAELCQKIGVELIETEPKYRGALILRGNKFHSVPDGLQLMSVHQLTALLSTPLLTWSGRIRAAWEPFVSRRTSADEESLQDFAIRRFGREMFDRIIQPLVSGIYTADPRKLSVAAALPQYVQQEKKYGSLFKAALAKRSAGHVTDRGARYSMFRAPAHGMQSLVDKLEDTLRDSVDIRMSSPVTSIAREHDGWKISLESGEPETHSAVIAATPAPIAAQLLNMEQPNLSGQIAGIEHVSTAVVCLGFRRSQVTHPLNAFGCVIPAIENRKLLAISFTNVKFPTRAPEDCVLVRAFTGGALQPELAELPDDELMSTVQTELSELLGITGNPLSSVIVRWPRTTPQYHIGHVQRIAAIEESLASLPGFAMAGNAYRGVGLPQCIRSGWQAADRITGRYSIAPT